MTEISLIVTLNIQFIHSSSITVNAVENIRVLFSWVTMPLLRETATNRLRLQIRVGFVLFYYLISILCKNLKIGRGLGHAMSQILLKLYWSYEIRI